MANRFLGLPLAAAFLVLSAALPAAPYLVKDLNTSPATEPGQVSPGSLGTGPGVSYFAAGDPAHGVELWRSDGTPGGTERLTDICAGRCSAQPAAISVRAGRVFFKANDGFSGDELWVSDGTPGSERRVRDVCPGPCSAVPGRVEEVGERLLFVSHLPASEEPDRFELWQTDGTRGGSARVKTLCNTPCTVASDLTPVAGKALFIVKPQPWESELWVTDGTADGTRPFRELGHPIVLREFGPFVVPGDGFAWVAADDGLWRTDGTAAGTFRLKRIDELAAEPGETYFDSAVSWHGLYFAFLITGEMIRSDGTPEGTFRITRFPAGSYATDFAPLDSEILFQLHDPSNRTVLWSSRGTADTTAPLDLGLDPETGAPCFLTSLGGDRVVFLWVPFDSNQAQLWVTDGTAAGTRQLTAPAGYAVDDVTGEAFFLTGDGRAFFFRETADRLWITDGTAAGTQPVRNFGDAPGSSGPLEQAALGDALGGRLIFSALATDAALPALFASDGTAAGTGLLSADATSASSFFRFGDRLLFSAGKRPPSSDATWVTDGNPAGTIRLKKIPFAHPARLGGEVLFSGYSDGFGNELWKISSLTRPIDLLKNINPFYDDLNPSSGQFCVGESSQPVPGVVVGGRLLFAADDGRSGRELWATDGTRAGTVLLRDINPGRSLEVPEPCDFGPFGPPRHTTGLASGPRDFVLLGNVALFTADDGLHGRELWTTNGTFPGTRRVADLLQGSRGSEPHDLVRFQNRVYFFAADYNQGESLWRTDGTTSGTTRLRDLSLNGQPGWGRNLTVAAGRLFFVVYNETTGAELWSSTGDFNGTGLVTDLNPGPVSSSPQSLTAIGGALLFAADDGLTGLEPWRTDGTVAGTIRLGDIAPGRDASSPGPFTAIQNLVITGVDDGIHGREPWAIPRAEIVRPPG
jgi:ELWxxDGT repeat protein